MELLEREQPIEDLKGLLSAATNGRGHIVFVSGEARIGKTSLVEHFLRRHSGDVRKLIGDCEALFTPRPLDPFCDIASQSQGKLHALVKQDFPRALLFSSLLDELQKSTVPTILVFEDIHWADEATLDLIKFLGRRIQSLSVLLLLTFRNDELGPDHPLWFVMGDLPHQTMSRIRLLPLSDQAVAHMAHEVQRPAEQLHTITGGNPFFISE